MWESFINFTVYWILLLNLPLLRTAKGDVPGELQGGRPGEGGPAADVASSARAAAGGRTRRGDDGGRGGQQQQQQVAGQEHGGPCRTKSRHSASTAIKEVMIDD